MDGNNGKFAERTVVKSTNWSQNGSDLPLRQPTDQKVRGSNPLRRANNPDAEWYLDYFFEIRTEFF